MPPRLIAVLFLLLLALPRAHAQTAATPRQLIEHLGVQVRQLLKDSKSTLTPQAAEHAVAEQIGALVQRSPEHPSLTEADPRGRTPLMLAVSDGYAQVVKALLADASVKRKLNEPDAAGETAWMVAQFAPSMTLVACQPGALTLERAWLLQPYLNRMAALLDTKPSAVAAIVQALEDAGAQADREGARRAWLARCPNAAPELRQTLSRGELLPTLVNEAITRQTAFNKAYAQGLSTIPQKPPEGMRFIPTPIEPPAEGVQALNCARMAAPQLRGALNWSGEVLFQVNIATRAGVVEVADFDVVAQDAPDPNVVDYFRSAILRALAAYQCEGDHVFQQEFRFKVG